MRLGELVGNASSVQLLKRSCTLHTPRAYLISGPPGCGKSAAAQALATELGIKLALVNCARPENFLHEENTQDLPGILWDRAEFLTEVQATQIAAWIDNGKPPVQVFLAERVKEVPKLIQVRSLQISMGLLSETEMLGLVNHWLGEAHSTYTQQSAQVITERACGNPGIARRMVDALPEGFTESDIPQNSTQVFQQLWDHLEAPETWKAALPLLTQQPVAILVEGMANVYAQQFLSKGPVLAKFPNYWRVSECCMKWQRSSLPGPAFFIFLRELLDTNKPLTAQTVQGSPTVVSKAPPEVPYEELLKLSQRTVDLQKQREQAAGEL